ncbi:MAG: ATP-grasp domain-containing protein [Gammaproteobacteria bacterium]
MRLFICEFITGGGLQDKELPYNLVREGNMMLDALLIDLLDSGFTDIITTRDKRLDPILLPVESVPIKGDIYHVWQSCMNDADAVWIIAPESDDVLFDLTLMAEQSDCHVLGCSSESVKSASSKLQTSKLLNKNDIPCIETVLFKDETIPESECGWVIKPDDGVGGEDCYFCANREDLKQLKDSISVEHFVIQKYLPGIPASLSMICYQGKAQLLACNEQQFCFKNGKGKLTELVVNGMQEQWIQFNKIAQKIAIADTGLFGYIGIDLIVPEDGVGSESVPVVVEINPRLTTSYVGLRQSLSLNPAELILSIWQNGTIHEVHKKQFLPVNLFLEGANVV